MRIAVIAPPWTPVPPTLYGGIELVVDRLATGFQRAGHEVMLFTTGDSTCDVPRQHVLPVAQGWRIGMAVPELIHVAAAYDAAQGFDIVHDHTIFGPYYAERFPELPVVTTVHGPLDGELAPVYERIATRVPVISACRSKTSSNAKHQCTGGNRPSPAAIADLQILAVPIGGQWQPHFNLDL